MSAQLASTSQPLVPAKPGELLNWTRLYGSSSSLAIAELSKRDGVVIYVCAETQNMSMVAKELSFFTPEDTPVLCFPDWECLPYDRVSPHADIISERLATLAALPDLKQGVVVVPMTALIQRLAPKTYLQGNSFQLRKGDDIDSEAFRERLINAGYYSVDQVMSPGEFAIRGGVIDVYPSGTDTPFRLDLFDTEIESIKGFDTETQRSLMALEEIQIMPAREFPVDAEGIGLFRQQFRGTIEGDAQKAHAYREISKGRIPAGAEFYLPLFFEQTNTLFDYVPNKSVFAFEEGALESIQGLLEEANDRYELNLTNPEWPPLAPDTLFQREDSLYASLKQYRRIQLLQLNLKSAKHLVDYKISKAEAFNVNPRSESPYEAFTEYLKNSTRRSLLIAESAGRRENLLGILKEARVSYTVVDSWQEFLGASHSVCVCTAQIDRGFIEESSNYEVICESQLYGIKTKQSRRRSQKNKDPDSIIRSLAELNIGDPVVHEEHGVGRYRGLETLNVSGDENEFATIEYHGGDKIYIPVLSLDLVSRYVGGSPETAPLHKMGTDTWIKLRKKAKEKAYDVAAELLEVQALRMARVGHAFPELDHSYDAFATGFGFEETPDQQQVIDDVINDMKSDKPMDRLVCGDVGFGKTEIALRAAYTAINGNKQVVMLVPTTLLAQQHYNNFTDRFADWPVRIELLSRFRTAKQTSEALAGLESGTVDIAIGTHKLLQKDIRFDDLGLMIIDEEHRFGVRQKEQLKKLRSQVDILTLTATPIPRTLNFALSGLRDISVIATPPRSRLSVKTFVREWDDALIKEAIVREMRRGGQVYFLHNEVQTIDKMQARIQDLVPDARIQIGHGQMKERELESVMRDFYHQRFNVLLCTTIIESGIDVPTANTIIINKADRFGLAQLHQLRGRVGRSHHQAYAYMLSPELNAMTEDARKRLLAIEQLDTLGAGFALASQDLEIRGAGELLGESQSGMIDQIGYSLYSQFLDQAIASIKRARQIKRGESVENVPHLEKIDINLNIPARFPDHFIPDVHLRLTMYKRIASAKDAQELEELQIETIDRFGLLPDSAKNLFTIAELKLACAQSEIKLVEAGPNGGKVNFLSNPNINIDNLMRVIAANPLEYRFAGPESIQIFRTMPEAHQRFQMVRDVLETIA